MITVKRFVGHVGERFAILVNSDGFPLTYPNLYSIIHLRNSGQKVNSIASILEDIELLYVLLDMLGIDIEQRIKDKS